MNIKGFGKKIIKLIKRPQWLIILMDRKGIRLLNDKMYIKTIYKCFMDKELNIDNPQTFNEKLQWLKLYNRNPKYTQMVDKNEVKKYVSEKIGEQYIIPTIGIYEKIEDIDFSKLPNQFVIKCTHDSGGLAICSSKENFDIAKAKERIKKSLKRNYYYFSREWPYKNVEAKILIEKYMCTEQQRELVDYKFFCINGKPEFLYVSEGLSNHDTAKISFVDMDYNKTPFYRKDYKPFEELPKKPENFEKMKELAEQLAKDIPFIRVDFYEIDGKIYFGELTFYPGGGYIPFEPEEWDKKLGDMLKLPKEKIEEKK